MPKVSSRSKGVPISAESKASARTCVSELMKKVTSATEKRSSSGPPSSAWAATALPSNTAANAACGVPVVFTSVPDAVLVCGESTRPLTRRESVRRAGRESMLSSGGHSEAGAGKTRDWAKYCIRPSGLMRTHPGGCMLKTLAALSMLVVMTLAACGTGSAAESALSLPAPAYDPPAATSGTQRRCSPAAVSGACRAFTSISRA